MNKDDEYIYKTHEMRFKILLSLKRRWVSKQSKGIKYNCDHSSKVVTRYRQPDTRMSLVLMGGCEIAF